jgi:hypothetical protein
MADQKFTQYAVIVFTDMSTLINDVNYNLARGWTLVGGIQVSAQGTATYHYQAMAK